MSILTRLLYWSSREDGAKKETNLAGGVTRIRDNVFIRELTDQVPIIYVLSTMLSIVCYLPVDITIAQCRPNHLYEHSHAPPINYARYARLPLPPRLGPRINSARSIERMMNLADLTLLVEPEAGSETITGGRLSLRSSLEGNTEVGQEKTEMKGRHTKAISNHAWRGV